MVLPNVEQIKAFAAYHIETIRRVLAAIPLYAWLAPILFFTLTYLLSKMGLSWAMEKQVQEIVAPVTIGLSAIIGWVAYFGTRKIFALLIALFVTALFLREWHFEGTDPGIYYVLIGLCYWASHRREDVSKLASRGTIGLFFGAAISTYLIADMVDRHWLIFLEPLLGEERIWQNYVEETMETLGHLMVFGLAVSSLWQCQHSKLTD